MRKKQNKQRENWRLWGLTHVRTVNISIVCPRNWRRPSMGNITIIRGTCVRAQKFGCPTNRTLVYVCMHEWQEEFKGVIDTSHSSARHKSRFPQVQRAIKNINHTVQVHDVCMAIYTCKGLKPTDGDKPLLSPVYGVYRTIEHQHSGARLSLYMFLNNKYDKFVANTPSGLS
jgi:hypothetical protein